MSGEWLLLKRGLHLGAEPIETATHVGHAGGNPDPRSCRKLDHLLKLSMIERSSL
jgi:hypothetical protein